LGFSSDLAPDQVQIIDKIRRDFDFFFPRPGQMDGDNIQDSTRFSAHHHHPVRQKNRFRDIMGDV
jgi:hypothetical protein